MFGINPFEFEGNGEEETVKSPTYAGTDSRIEIADVPFEPSERLDQPIIISISAASSDLPRMLTLVKDALLIGGTKPITPTNIEPASYLEASTKLEGRTVLVECSVSGIGALLTERIYPDGMFPEMPGFEIEDPKISAAKEMQNQIGSYLISWGKMGLETWAMRKGCTYARVYQTKTPGVVILSVECSPSLLETLEAKIDECRPVGTDVIITPMVSEKYVRIRMRPPRTFLERVQAFFGRTRFYERQDLELIQ